MMAEEMYADIILEYYRNPVNKGVITNPDISARDSNPSCGDVVEINIKLNDKHVKEIKFNGKGCVISQASASILTEFVKGKSIDDVKRITNEDIFKLLGIKLSAVRVKCALLPLNVLKIGVCDYAGEKFDNALNNNNY